MNLAETYDLLSLAAQYDRRIVDDPTVVAWQVVLADIELDDAMQAVIQHVRRRPDTYLNVGHVHEGAIAMRRARHAQAARAAQARKMADLETRQISAPPVTPEEIAVLKTRMRAMLTAKAGPSDPAKLHPRRERFARERAGIERIGGIGLRLVVDNAPSAGQSGREAS